MSEDSGFRRFVILLRQEQDQRGAQIREEYLRLSERARGVLRQWVDAVVLAGEPPLDKIGMSVSVRIHLEAQGFHEMETVAVNPKALAKAMAAWDSGEGFTDDPAIL
jgi:hypothetical protein